MATVWRTLDSWGPYSHSSYVDSFSLSLAKHVMLPSLSLPFIGGKPVWKSVTVTRKEPSSSCRLAENYVGSWDAARFARVATAFCILASEDKKAAQNGEKQRGKSAGSDPDTDEPRATLKPSRTRTNLFL